MLCHTALLYNPSLLICNHGQTSMSQSYQTSQPGKTTPEPHTHLVFAGTCKCHHGYCLFLPWTIINIVLVLIVFIVVIVGIIVIVTVIVIITTIINIIPSVDFSTKNLVTYGRPGLTKAFQTARLRWWLMFFCVLAKDRTWFFIFYFSPIFCNKAPKIQMISLILLALLSQVNPSR